MMNGTILGTLIWENIKENVTNGSPEDLAGLAKWIQIATDIVTHIQTQGVVNTTGSATVHTGTVS